MGSSGINGKIDADMFKHSLMTFGDKFSASEVDNAFGEFLIEDGMIDAVHLKVLWSRRRRRKQNKLFSIKYQSYHRHHLIRISSCHILQRAKKTKKTKFSLVHDAVRVLRRVVDVRLVVLHVLRVHRVVEAFTAASLLPPAEDKDADAEEESEDGEEQEDDPPGELCADVEHRRLAGDGLLEAGGDEAGVGADVLLGGVAQQQRVVGEDKLRAST